MPKSRYLNDNKQQLIALLALFVIIAALSLTAQNFFDVQNALNIGKQASINLIIALGMTVVILSGGIDLSVGSLMALTVTVSAVLWNVHGMHIVPAVALGLLAPTIAGAISGAITHYGRVPSFITTLGFMGILRGVVLLLSKGNPAMTFPPEYLWLADGSILGIPFPIVLAALMTAFVAGILNYSTVGRGFYAVGGNEEAARLSGISIAKVRIVAFTLSGFCCAVAGLIFAARVGAAPPSAGQGYELSAIAAVVIGGTPLMGGQGKISGTVIGALLMAVIQNGLNLLQIDPYWQSIIIGSIIVVAVMASQYRK
jgi:ribose transport system permease protein